MLEVGTKAPEFTLPDKDGNNVSLSDFRGKKVVLYFYPKDNTPGCTRQACAFAGAYSQFEALGVVVIGVSRDSQASHQRFAEKNSLPFILLSDPERQAIEAYGVWQEKKNYAKVSMGVVRSTYIIDENGVIEKVMPKVKPDTNAAEILEMCIRDRDYAPPGTHMPPAGQKLLTNDNLPATLRAENYCFAIILGGAYRV